LSNSFAECLERTVSRSLVDKWSYFAISLISSTSRVNVIIALPDQELRDLAMNEFSLGCMCTIVSHQKKCSLFEPQSFSLSLSFALARFYGAEWPIFMGILQEIDRFERCVCTIGRVQIVQH
jgi:hypothetical protein